MDQATAFVFAGHTLDLVRGRLLRLGEDVYLRPKAMTLLTHLIRNAGRVISKDELVATVWPDVIVSDDSLTQCMKDIRRALGSEAEGLIRTILRRGYVVDEARVATILTSGLAEAAIASPRLPDKPSIAVLPFDNLSGEPAQDYFADGMVEEITTALSRMRWLFVIARNSSYAFKGRIVDAREIGRALGVRYLLEGSVRRAGGRIRLAGQLIDAESGSQLWADRYDGDLADIFDLQDRITEHVVGAIQPSILSAEVERARRKRPESLDAYDLVLRAFPLVWSLDKDQNETARLLLAQALAHDVDYPFALSLLAWCHAQRAVYGWTDAPGRDRDEGLRLAQRAASLSHDDPMVLAILGAAHSFAGDFEVAETHLERARSLDPNSAWAWLRSAWLDVYRERTASALGHFARFRRLSPLDPITYMADVGVGAVHFIDGRYDDAIAWTQRGLSQQPDASWILRHLVTAYAHAGRLDDAKRTCLRLRQSYPDLTLAKVKDTWRLGERTMARIISGLRDAGLPES
jgi:adenylate cyclase